MPIIEILQEVDVSKYAWCNSAVLFRINGGLGTITHKVGREDKNFNYYSQTLINDKPVIQGSYLSCPTCAGMLATGYGTENIDCPQLRAVRECLNSDYTDIRTSAEMLKPLLRLLEDGYYLLADVPHDPTDGNSRFFWSVPNELTKNPAVCDEYYNSEFYGCVESFPAYLYPTQSAELCNQKRIDEYVEILCNNPNPPRALAYHEYGFVSALLDGHHKATASAILGKKVNCLTIIKETAHCLQYDPKLQVTTFSAVHIPTKNIKDYINNRPNKNVVVPDLKPEQYSLTGRSFPEAEKNAEKCYLNIDSLMDFYAVDVDNMDFTDEMIDEWISYPSDENYVRLRCAISYLMLNDRDMAYRTAVKIVSTDYTYLPYIEAWTALTEFKDEQTEQLMIDHIVEYGKDSLDVVTSYWD